MPEPDPLLDRPAWAPAWVPSVDDVRQIRFLRWALVAVLAVGIGACVVRGADEPADPTLAAPSTTSAVEDLAATFGTALVEVVTASGEALELCLLHADQPAERTQGLRQVTDLQGHAGMLFSFDQPAETSFVMIDTVMPLWITWWRPDGTFLSVAEMAPCTEADPATCPRYTAGAPFAWAVEVPQGSLPGIGEGARLQVTGEGCTPG